MFVDTHITDAPDRNVRRKSPEELLQKIAESSRARLRIYVGAAAGVGKTFQILKDGHGLKAQGIDVVIGTVETHGRAETAEMIGDLELISPRRIDYRGVVLNELNIDAIIERNPNVAIIDELAHSNVDGSKNRKRYQDIIEILNCGISVITAVNVQHIESLNDVVFRSTGVRVRETVPDSFFSRADEIIDVDIAIDTLRTRLRQGKIYPMEKIEQSLNNFFRKGNLAVLRELALRQAACFQAAQDQEYREREGLEPAVIPEKVMVCIASRGSGKRLLRTGARIAGRLATNDWFAVYVATPSEEIGRLRPEVYAALMENIALAKSLGAKMVTITAKNVADALVRFARENEVTHVIFGQSARSKWDIIWKGSVINRFLSEAKDATVHVIPVEKEN